MTRTLTVSSATHEHKESLTLTFQGGGKNTSKGQWAVPFSWSASVFDKDTSGTCAAIRQGKSEGGPIGGAGQGVMGLINANPDYGIFNAFFTYTVIDQIPTIDVARTSAGCGDAFVATEPIFSVAGGVPAGCGEDTGACTWTSTSVSGNYSAQYEWNPGELTTQTSSLDFSCTCAAPTVKPPATGPPPKWLKRIWSGSYHLTAAGDWAAGGVHDGSGFFHYDVSASFPGQLLKGSGAFYLGQLKWSFQGASFVGTDHECHWEGAGSYRAEFDVYVSGGDGDPTRLAAVGSIAPGPGNTVASAGTVNEECAQQGGHVLKLRRYAVDFLPQLAPVKLTLPAKTLSFTRKLGLKAKWQELPNAQATGTISFTSHKILRK